MANEMKKIDLEGIRKQIEDAKENISTIEKRFEKKINDNPIASISFAFGAGAIAGAVAAAIMGNKK